MNDVISVDEFNDAMRRGIERSKENANKTVEQMISELLDMIDRVERGEVL